MATHNATEGTGGLDASLYYELDRQEVRKKNQKEFVQPLIDGISLHRMSAPG